MVVTYSDHVLRGFVAQICRDMGWHASHSTSLDVLAQLAAQYTRQLSARCVHYANHCGRPVPTFDDIGHAFNHFNIDLQELKDYVQNVDSQPLDVPVPKYPIANVSNRVVNSTASDEERPEWYYEWMPPLRETQTSGAGGDESGGDTSKLNEDILQDSLTSPPLPSSSSSAQVLALESGAGGGPLSPRRAVSAAVAVLDSFGFLRDLPASVGGGQREGRLPDTQRVIESEESRENTPEREVKVEEKPIKPLVDKEMKKKDRKEKRKDRKDAKLSAKGERSKLKPKKFKIKAIVGKGRDKSDAKEGKKLKKVLKIKELGRRPYSPLAIKVIGLSTGNITATSTPTMARSPASVVSPNEESVSKMNASFDSSIDAVIDRICTSRDDNESNVSVKQEEELSPKKKYKLKREESGERPTSAKKSRKEKDNPAFEMSMSETIDEVVRQSQSALLSPSAAHKRSPHWQPTGAAAVGSPKAKAEHRTLSSPSNQSKSDLKASAAAAAVVDDDDEEAAKALVMMFNEKNGGSSSVTKRGRKHKLSIPTASAAAASATSPPPEPDSSPARKSAFKSAMSAFPKVSPGASPLSPTMFSMTNQVGPQFGTQPMFGQRSPPLLTPVQSGGSPPHQYSGPPPTLTKPKTLAEKKAMPPEIMNAPLVAVKKEKENKTDRKDRDRERDRDRKEKKTQKLVKNKKFKSRKTISTDEDTSSEEEVKPKINIKLGSTGRPKSTGSDKLSAKSAAAVNSKPVVKTPLSPKHNVSNQEDMSSAVKKKRGPKKKEKKEEPTEDTSCIVIRETITVDTGEGNGKVWICPECKRPDDGSPMIGCDTCDEWYHYECVGIRTAPGADESWFCQKCVKKQKQIEPKVLKTAKKKDTKKRVKDK
ncbi:unnamed protein product [Medioppia subpectinata]|uniref:PHD-type domain-containing protein n=1 Tax=Medioppia subpectinata TaxID=1979941 RepID=A0A7R9KKE7_9ACAR|nr:unnamed protein product [Medioppia subpectinata]CAG2105073.1 unnamed protein product [Medioppia subpectinata]